MPVKTSLITLFLAGAAACSVHAQSAPVGGPDARGNSPIKHAHTINAGSATPGANSFTQSQARRHIEHLGYTDVSALTKGKDGVWRGTAMRGGLPVDVALDFKGNVTQAVANAGTQPAPMTSAPASADGQRSHEPDGRSGRDLGARRAAGASSPSASWTASPPRRGVLDQPGTERRGLQRARSKPQRHLRQGRSRDPRRRRAVIA